jgi:ribosomal protein L44E
MGRYVGTTRLMTQEEMLAHYDTTKHTRFDKTAVRWSEVFKRTEIDYLCEECKELREGEEGWRTIGL